MFRIVFALTAAVLLVQPAAWAQVEESPAGGLENSEEYKETQEIIDKTQARILEVQRQNEARAEEIEAIADKVGAIISTMSSQGEDNTNLRSEISVLTELLTIERQTTSSLRSDVNRLNDAIAKAQQEHSRAEQELEQKLKAERAAWAAKEQELHARIRAAEAETNVAEKRLSAALESIAGHARTNRQLVSDIDALNKEVEQLRRQEEMRRRLRNPTRLPAPN